MRIFIDRNLQPNGKYLFIYNEIIRYSTHDTNQFNKILILYSKEDFEEPSDLHEWISILNILDEKMSTILSGADTLYLPEKGTTNMVTADINDDPEVVNTLIAILQFTAVLLRSCCNKEIYNSTELLLKLLRSYNDDIAILALEAVTALACPPLIHRCANFTPHTTAMHKSSANCIPLFQIVEAANWPFSVIAEQFLSPEFPLHEKHTTLEFDISQRPKVYGSDVASDMTPGLIQSLFVISNIHLDPRHVKTILSETWLPHKYLFALMWRIRLLRRITTLSGRISILIQQYRSILILLCCHPNTSVLSHFFQDKTDLLRDFIFMVRTGPGSSDYPKYQQFIPLTLRLLASQCLIAIVGSRDSSSISVMGRFSWLQHDLGVNRGQYMGLLPCLLRSAVSFMSSLSQNEDLPSSEHGDESTIRDRLLWTETIFTLTLALISVSNALTALTENGFITLLLSVVKLTPFPSRTSLQIYVEILVIQILDMSLTGHPLALTVFEDLSGIDALLERVIKELTLLAILPSDSTTTDTRPSKRRRKEENLLDIYASSKSNMSICEHVVSSDLKIYINSVLGIFSLYLHESHGHQGQFLRSPMFGSLFSILFKNANALSASIMTSAITLFSEVINNDPLILSHMIANGLAQTVLLSMMENSKQFTGDCLLISLNCISALSLTAQGKEVVLSTNPFPSLFSFFHNPQLLKLEKRSPIMDMSNTIGGTLEELLRHHPELAEPCTDALLAELQFILGIMESYEGLTMEDGQSNHPDVPCTNFTTLLHFTKALFNCIEAILMKKENIHHFLGKGGVVLLTQLLRLTHKPARYVVASFSCSTDPSTHSLGHYPIVKAVTKSFGQIADKEPKLLIHDLLASIKPTLDTLSQKITLFWAKNGGKPEYLESDNPLCHRVTIDDDTYHISNEFFLHKFLDCVPRIPLQNNCSNGTLSDELLVYAAVLQEFMVLDYLVEGLSLAISVIQGRPSLHSSLQELTKPETLSLIKRLVDNLYVGSQQELCRARGVLAEAKKSERVKLHPVYRLLIIANDSVSVRDSVDDTGKKIYKLEKGVIVNAYERATGNDNLIKYHIDDGTSTGGWVSYFRSHETLEPQIEVIDTIRSEADEVKRAAEFLAKRKSVSTQKRFDFDKVANVSPRRGGFMILFHFHYCMRHFLKSLAWTFTDLSKENSSTSELLPLVYNCLGRLLPVVPSQLCVDPLPPSRDIVGNTDIQNGFFVSLPTPNIDQFSIEKTFRTIHVVELCHYFLFEEKKGSRGDPNILLLTYLYYGKFIEKLALATSVVFLTCLREPLLNEESQKSSSNLSDILAYRTAMEVLDEDNDDDESDTGLETIEDSQSTEKYLRKKLKDRRMLAVSNVDLIIDLWKNFFRSYIVTSSGPLELMELSDGTHFFDPIALKRKLLLTLARYVGQSWSHPHLHSLPPTTVKNVLDLVQVVLKSIFDAKNDPLTSRNKTAKQRRRLQPFVDSDSDHNDDVFDLIRRVMEAHEEGLELDSADTIGSDQNSEDVLQEEVNQTMPVNINETLELSTLTHILPPIVKSTSMELKQDQQLLDILHKYIYATLPNSCYRLIERGIRSGGVQWRSEAAILNQNITREFTTVMVLSQLLSCLERPHLSESTLRIIQLSLLYPRAATLLESEFTISSSIGLYGLLHSILLLLSGKITSSSKFSKRNEMVYLIFGHRGNFSDFYDRLIARIEHILSAVLSSSIDSFSDNPCLDWISPALLILDVMSQPILFDKENVQDSLKELRIQDENSRTQDEPPSPLINGNIKSFLIRRFGFTAKDFSEDIMDEVQAGTTSSLPLEIENGLTTALAIRVLNITIMILKMLKSGSKRAGGVYQAAMQLLVHLTRAPEIRQHLLTTVTIRDLFHYCTQFEGSTFFLFSLILHLTEDSETLSKTMESVMRFCIQRISKTESSKSLKKIENTPSAINLDSFVGILTPLLYRNEEIFMKVFKENMRIFEQGRTLMVGLKDGKSLESHDVIGPRGEGIIEKIVDELILALMAQWIKLSSLPQNEKFGGCNKRSNPLPLVPPAYSPLNISISDLLVLLADLVTSVPGLATCIHKFHLSTAVERVPTEMKSIVRYCLSEMKHVVTGETLHSTSFMTFLVHYLLTCQQIFPLESGPMEQSSSSSEIQSDEDKNKKDTILLLGKSIADSPAYLLAALLARPGDGRRRTMKEFLNAFKLHDHPLDTTEKLKAVSILSSTLQKYLTTHPAWKRSEMLVLPTKDLLDMMSTQKAYQLLSDDLCSISLDHPLAQQISLDLAAPLEVLIRKGISDIQTDSITTPISQQRKRLHNFDLSIQQCTQEVAVSSTPGPGGNSTEPHSRTESSQISNDLPIEVSMSEYVSPVDDQDFEHRDIYHSDGDDDPEEEDEVDDEDDDDDDEEEEDDDEDENSDDDDDHDEQGVSFYVDEDGGEMSSGDDEPQEEEEMDVVNPHQYDEPLHVEQGTAENEQEDGVDDEDEDEDEPADEHAENMVDHLLSMFSGSDIIIDDGHDVDEDQEDEDENPEEEGNVEQEMFLNGEIENPELESEFRRTANSPVDDEEGDDDDGGGIDPTFLVNRLEDDDVQLDVNLPRSSLTSRGHGTVQIHHNSGGVQVHIQGNEAMFDLLAQTHMPNTPMFNPRLQRSGSARIPYDIRNFLSQMTSLGNIQVHSRFHGQPQDRNRNEDTNATTSQPVLHPLLAVSDPRQAREIFSSSNPPGRSQAMMDHMLSAIDSHGPFGSRTFGAQQRMDIVERRRLLNPYVCDRRWGTDIGELELVGGRIKTLVEAFKLSVEDLIEKKNHSSCEDSKEDVDDNPSRLWEQIARLRGNSSSGAREEPPQPVDTIPEFQLIFPSNIPDGMDVVPEPSSNSIEPELAVTNVTASPVQEQHLESVPTIQENLPADEESKIDEPSSLRGESLVSDQDIQIAGSINVNIENSIPVPDNSNENSAPLECPPGIDREVWESLPLEVQLELVGSSDEAALNIPADDADLLEATELDRDTLAELPPEMRTEVLRDEAVVRMRRQSFDDSGNLRPTNAESTSTDAGQSNYGETFLASLPPELREDALLSADETFLSTLPPAIQNEARELRRAHSQINLTPGLLFWGNESHGRENDLLPLHRLGSPETLEESRRPLRRPASSITAGARRTAPKKLIETAVTILHDNISPLNRVPFGRFLSHRMLLQLYTTRRARLPKPLLKLMVAMSKYRIYRRPILESIVGMMFHDILSVSNVLHEHFEEKGATVDYLTKHKSRTNDGASLLQLLQLESEQHEPVSPVVIRRLLNAVYYLCKKTEKLAWYDVMDQSRGKWIFGQLLELLVHPSMASNANVDMILHVIQELLEDFSKLSVSTANALVARRTAPSILDTSESPSWDRTTSKRARLSPTSVGSNLPDQSLSNQESIPDGQVESSEPTRPPKSVEVAGQIETIRCDLPFPVLDDHAAQILAGLVHYENCGGVFPSRLSRILTTLSLHDENWTRLLECFRQVAEDVALATIQEAKFVRQLLDDVVKQNGTAASAMSVPYLSTPSSVSELRLLHVLRLLTSLRPKDDENEGEQLACSLAAVSAIIKRIDFQDLWDLLVGSLDLVRNLEGIVELEGETAVKEKDNAPALSALTMRFVPLIECYLTVCGNTLLKTFDEIQSTSETEGQSLKRSRSLESVEASSETSTTQPSLKIQKNQMPGLRFRQTAEFKRMQQDLEDNSSSRRLLRFVERNSVLLNMVLKQNVNLLESSLSPLIQIPKCRALLHFDIKRAFFKMKLKKMKRNTQRPFESSRLRLSVRRQAIFEDSFQKLRFCSAAEMRRPLSVTFHGEEGIDAGGVAREWYSELAKEIFNANYCLFDNATHDNVTFQPNPYSHINSHHLDYFKFVGRVIGKAICDGQLLDAHFTRSFYKHILGVPISYHDLEATEPEFYKSLLAILEHPLELLGLELTFTAELNEFGKVEVVDLVEGGRNIPVTDENKLDYVRLVAHHRMTSAILKQINAFLEGFHELVPPELVSIFDAQELELLISGLPDIDLDDLRAHTEYQGYKPSDPVISYFWSVLRGFSQEEKALFLQFVTGTSKVPLDGFQALRGSRGVQFFSIHKAFGTHLLPCAHTCFNQLDLPEYATEEELKEKLLLSMREGAVGFGLA